MKTRFTLLGLSAALLMAAVHSVAQDPSPPDSPSPPAKPRRSKDLDLPTTPVLKDTQLLDKLKAAGANLSPPVLEIVRMSDSGADTAVIQAYVETAPIAYSLRAEEVIYLKDHGIPPSIITAMIQHGAKLREQAAAAPPPEPLPPAVTAPETVEATVPAYSPSPTYVYPSQPVYYPSYAYNYPGYYYPWYPSFGVYFSGPYGYRHSVGGYHGHGAGGGNHSHYPSGTFHSPTHSGFHP